MKTHNSTTSTLESRMRSLAERELECVAAAGSARGIYPKPPPPPPPQPN